MSSLKKFTLVAMVAMMALQPMVGAVAAQPATNDDLNYSATNAPNWYVYEDQVDIAAYNMSAFDDPRAYYDDNGDKAFLPASLNQSIDNRIGFVATHIDDEDLGVWPRKGEEDNAASALDASEWTVGGTNSSKISVTQTTGQAAQNVESVDIQTDGSMASGDSAYASYSNVSITTDPAKRVLASFVEVNSLDSGAQVAIQVRDGEGDYVEATINASQDPTTADVIANQTGAGYVYQQKIADLTVEGTGDGSVDAIQEIRVEVTDADADVTITGLDVGRKSAVDLGSYKVNTDDDDALESETIQEITTPGEHRYTSVAAIGSTFQDAVIYRMSVYGLKYDVKHAEKTAVEFNSSYADAYKSFPTALNYHAKLVVPTAIDLTHHSLELRAEQAFVEDRYIAFEYVEGASDTQFSELDSWTSLSDQLQGQGDVLTGLDTTIQPGTSYAVHTLALVYEEEKAALTESGAVAHRQKQPGGLMSMIIGPLGGAIAALLAVFGISWKMR